MSKRPEHLDYPVHWQWPFASVGLGLFAVGFWIKHDWWAYGFYLAGAIVLGVSRFLGWVAAQLAWETARAEMKRGEREYLWDAALRWIRSKK